MALVVGFRHALGHTVRYLAGPHFLHHLAGRVGDPAGDTLLDHLTGRIRNLANTALFDHAAGRVRNATGDAFVRHAAGGVRDAAGAAFLNHRAMRLGNPLRHADRFTVTDRVRHLLVADFLHHPAGRHRFLNGARAPGLAADDRRRALNLNLLAASRRVPAAAGARVVAPRARFLDRLAADGAGNRFGMRLPLAAADVHDMAVVYRTADRVADILHAGLVPGAVLGALHFAIRRVIDRATDRVRTFAIVGRVDRSADVLRAFTVAGRVDRAADLVALLAVAGRVDRLADLLDAFRVRRRVARTADRVALVAVMRFMDRPGPAAGDLFRHLVIHRFVDQAALLLPGNGRNLDELWTAGPCGAIIATGSRTGSFTTAVTGRAAIAGLSGSTTRDQKQQRRQGN